MKVGNLVRFKVSGVIALIVEITKGATGTLSDVGYTSVKLHVLGNVLADTACADGFTYVTEQMLRRTAEVIDAS